MKNKKTRRIVIGLIILVIVILLFRQYRKNRDKDKGTNDSSNTTTQSGGNNSSASTFTETTILKRGMNSSKASKNVIKWSQYEINQIRSKTNLPKLAEDGIFGEKTEKAFNVVLGRNTGTYREVYNRVREIGLYGLYGSNNSNSDDSWYYADGTKVTY